MAIYAEITPTIHLVSFILKLYFVVRLHYLNQAVILPMTAYLKHEII